MRLPVGAFWDKLERNWWSMGRGLTRIFYTDLLQKLGIMMNTSLDSHFDLGRIGPYSPAFKCSSLLSHHASQLPRHDQHEISWFTV